MATLLGQAFWPGAVGCISCSYTCSHGVTPGIATLEIPEQDSSKIKSYGTLVITDGARTIKLPRARVVGINYNQSESGRSIVLSIADRRWMYQYGAITGNWNQVDQYPDPSLFPAGNFSLQGSPYVPGTYRLASDLIDDCFAALNESNYIVPTPPNVVLPVQWDSENPGQALAGILDQIGFRLCYSPVVDGMLVAPAGQGLTLPSNIPFTTNHPSISLPTKPNVIQLVGGDALFFDQLALEPVGMEYDGTFKPIAQLSYAPPLGDPDPDFGGSLGGWGYCNPVTMATVVATPQLTKLQAIELAKQYVWRTFRVKMVDVSEAYQKVEPPGPIVAGYGPIQYRQQIILQPSIIGSTKELNGQPSSKDAYVTGSIYVTENAGSVPLGLAKNISYGNTQQLNPIPLPYKPIIGVARQIVSFDRQMFRNGGSGRRTKYMPPRLYLYTSFKIQNVIGRVPVRFVYGANFGGTSGGDDDNPNIQGGTPELGCPPQVLRHPELVLTTFATRDPSKQVTSVGNNLNDLRSAAQYYIDAANQQYQPQLAIDRTYAGIWPISPDGAIRQVTWSVGGGRPATTQASLNSEHNYYVPQYPERRRNEAAKDWADKEALRQLSNSTGTNASGSGGQGVAALLNKLPIFPIGIW
jgi:hypothetical protein